MQQERLGYEKKHVLYMQYRTLTRQSLNLYLIYRLFKSKDLFELIEVCLLRSGVTLVLS